MAEPLLLGTNNQGKVVELAEIFRGLPWDIRSLADFPPVPAPIEEGDTFEANAIAKAAYFSQRFNVWCVADDSGLVVDALGGGPGVLSARYAGPDATDSANSAKLLAALEGTPESERTARFVCCAAVVKPDGDVHVEFGTVEGRIAFELRGRSGFGYDHLFIAEGFDKTFAEVGPARKLAVSHRGRAFRKLRAYLESL